MAHGGHIVHAPRPRTLAYNTNIHVARCVLGLTIYTRHSAPSPAAGVATLLSEFLSCAPRERLQLFSTSLMPEWAVIKSEELPRLVEELSSEGFGSHGRHLFSFNLAERADASELFFSYREVDGRRNDGLGYVQLGLPLGTPPPILFQLAMEAAHRTPLVCGVGGYIGSAHPIERCTSFSAFHSWTKRFWGVDIQDPERARHHAEQGLPGTNWLTLVGRELFTRRNADPGALQVEARRREIDWLEAQDAVVVRAGPAPTVGDNHQMDLAPHYQRAAALLAPLMLEDPVRLYGHFWEDDGAARWAKRFLEPMEWST